MVRDDKTFPTAACPVTGVVLILPSSVIRPKDATPVNCPSCGEVHVWSPTNGLTALKDDGIADAEPLEARAAGCRPGGPEPE